MPKRLYSLDSALAATNADRRRRLRWSQNRLALEAGLTEGLIAKLETCRVPFTPDHAAAIEHALSLGQQTAVQPDVAVLTQATGRDR